MAIALHKTVLDEWVGVYVSALSQVCCMVVDLMDGQGLAPLMSSIQDCSELSDQLLSGGSSTDLQNGIPLTRHHLANLPCSPSIVT